MDANPNPSLKHLQQVKREELDEIKGNFTLTHTLYMNMCLCAGQESRVPEASTVRSVRAASPLPSLAHHSPMDQTKPGRLRSQREGTGQKSPSTAGRGLTQHGQRVHPSSATKGIQILDIWFSLFHLISPALLA